MLLTLRAYWSDKHRFADFFHAVLFDGEEALSPDELQEMDSTYAEVITAKGKSSSVARYRDVVKMATYGFKSMFKECLKNRIIPFIITEELKMFYYRGLNEWKNESGYLLDTYLTAQEQFRAVMQYFRIEEE